MPKTQARICTYAEALLEATRHCLRSDKRVLVVGEGVPDPKAIFGTTKGLQKEFGPERVMDMPLSENGLTGILVGTALGGMRPIMIHQRVDFLMLAMDQIVNNAAKWRFMFNGLFEVPIVIRALIGRGWGQGPQHSQSLQGIFAQIPGLKVVMPATPYDAKGMLIQAVQDPNPVIFIEHRWLHQFKDNVPPETYQVPLGEARVIRKGKHATVAALSHMVIEALRVAERLADEKIDLEVIDMRSVRPLDTKTVLKSVKKTGRLAVLDSGPLTGGVPAEILAQVVERAHQSLKSAPLRITGPDHPIPTSFYVANACYPEAGDIAAKIARMCGVNDDKKIDSIIKQLKRSGRLDVPHFDFKGPF